MTDKLFELITSYRKTQVIYCAVKLGVMDLLSSEKMLLVEIAKELKVDECKLKRILNCLESLEIISRDNANYYYLTDLGKPLSSNSDNSIESRAIFHGELAYYAWGALEKSLHSTKPAFNEYFHNDFFQYLNENPKISTHFNELMKVSQNKYNQDIVEILDIKHDENIIMDVGGGYGHLAESIKLKYPDKEVVVFDMSSVIEKVSKSSEYKDNIEYISGDFFENIPSCNLLILKRILHDWDDSSALKILDQCKKSLKMNGRLIIIENLFDISNKENIWLDLNMMILFNGRERTIEQYNELCSGIGAMTRKHYLGELVVIEYIKK